MSIVRNTTRAIRNPFGADGNHLSSGNDCSGQVSFRTRLMAVCRISRTSGGFGFNRLLF